MLPPILSTQEVQICNGDQVLVGDSVYTNAGTFENLLISDEGCDSIVITTILLVDEYLISLEEIICAGEFYTVGDSIYSESGNYSNFFISSSNCDSTVFLNLTVLEVATIQNSISICEGDSNTTVFILTQ